jgi:N-acetylmuramoyl-L-alanine amidase
MTVLAKPFKLMNDKRHISGVDYEQAGSFGGKVMTPRFLIMHYTAGRSFRGTVDRFKDPSSKTSAHLVVGRGGELVQMVPFDRAAWHAGADSAFTNAQGAWKKLNSHSIGIEFDNYGPLTKVGSKFMTWFGRDVSSGEVAEVEPKKKGNFNIRYWHAYTPLQLILAEELATLLVREFLLTNILGHSNVAPGRKTDPGPLFPIAHLRSLVFGRADDEG